MAWKDNYRKGSFRGVMFDVETIESSYGRRQVTHEYPALEKPYTEDIGKAYNEFTVDAHLVGDEYQTARDALVKACRDEAGPGILVHPYLGEMSVVCRHIRIVETSAEGGLCVVSMLFIEAGEILYPSTITDSTSVVDSSATATEAASESAFLQKYDVPGLPDFIAGAAADQLIEFGQFFSHGLGAIDAALDEASEFVREVDDLVAFAGSIATNPALAFGSLSSIILKARRIYVDAEIVMHRLSDAFSADYVGGSATPNRQKQRDNYRAISSAIRQIAIAEAARDVVRNDYASYQDAISARDRITTRLDTESETTDNDDVYLALSALRSAVVRSIPAPEKQLPRLLEYTPPVTVPALLLAYQLYADASLDAEIVARNHIRNPCFIPGGVPIQVLADV